MKTQTLREFAAASGITYASARQKKARGQIVTDGNSFRFVTKREKSPVTGKKMSHIVTESVTTGDGLLSHCDTGKAVDFISDGDFVTAEPGLFVKMASEPRMVTADLFEAFAERTVAMLELLQSRVEALDREKTEKIAGLEGMIAELQAQSVFPPATSAVLPKTSYTAHAKGSLVYDAEAKSVFEDYQPL